MVKLLVQVVLSKIRVLFSGKEPVHIKPFISKKMKYEIGDRGVVATLLSLILLITLILAIIFLVYGTNLVR
jgi:hypothetical protein